MPLDRVARRGAVLGEPEPSALDQPETARKDEQSGQPGKTFVRLLLLELLAGLGQDLDRVRIAHDRSRADDRTRLGVADDGVRSRPVLVRLDGDRPHDSYGPV